MPIKIITDSGSDIPLEYVNQYDITVVQLPVHFGHELMPEDTDTKAFYAKMRESKDLPTTASPSPQVLWISSKKWKQALTLWSSACPPILAAPIRPR